ncbi:hypothetical protein [Pedobacter sp.]|uniref:hypothetical protein n=1 Tax=Pedobacter sp. TaxID=1411316 RepID=UPI003D7F2494
MKNIILLFFAILIFSSCKKDMITVSDSKAYSEVGYKGSDEVYDGGGIYVQLNPNGNAGFKLGGDAIHSATYKITGSTLKVYSNNKTYKFRIVSEDEIKYEDRTLRLVKE